MSPSRSLTTSCLDFRAMGDGIFLSQVRTALARVLQNVWVRTVAQVRHSYWLVARRAQSMFDGDFEVTRMVR